MDKNMKQDVIDTMTESVIGMLYEEGYLSDTEYMKALTILWKKD